MEGGLVLGVWTQVPQRILADSAGNPLLDGVGALDAQEETVARNNGSRGLPHHQGTVVADVSENHVSRCIGL